MNGSPGFSVASGTGDQIMISSIASGGAAERDGKLRVGDRVLSVRSFSEIFIGFWNQFLYFQ